MEESGKKRFWCRQKKADEIYKDVNQRLRGFELCLCLYYHGYGYGYGNTLYTLTLASSESEECGVEAQDQAIPTQSLSKCWEIPDFPILRVHGVLLWYVLPHFWFSLQFRTAVGWSLLSHVMLKAFIWSVHHPPPFFFYSVSFFIFILLKSIFFKECSQKREKKCYS